LNFVDNEQTIVFHEACRINAGGVQKRWSVQATKKRVWSILSNHACQRALAGLSGAIDENHPRVEEGFFHDRLDVSADHPPQRRNQLGHAHIISRAVQLAASILSN
jgi:hypothetical protein